MLKPPHPVAVAAYVAAMRINPNNHALDGGPGTSALEVEVVDQLAVMFGLPRPGLGHLTSSGTIANLEALWVARELRPGKRVVHCAAGALHPRAHVRGARREAHGRAPDADGRIDLDAVRGRVRARRRRARSCSPPAPPGWAPSTASTRRSPCASATACACTPTPPTAASSRCWRAATTRSSAPRPFAGDRAVRLRRRRPAQARAPALRVRRGALRRSVRAARFYSHDSPVHVLHLGRAAPRRDQPGVLARRRGGRRRCG